jgi:NADPH-dependent 2,4-dienoyl-CoA reductase/sulfur reductase-like enzyme
MHLVMIGGSDAGISAALRAREVDPSAEVTVVLADAYPNFSICGIPYYVSGEVTHWHNLAHRTLADLEAAGMRLRLDTTARRIDVPGRKLLITTPGGGEELLGYDALVIGTGAVPVRPPIAGLSGPDALGPGDGVHLLHSMGDTFAVMATLEQAAPASAVIVGGGYIGLEMADALTVRGLAVTQMEQLPEVLPAVDPELGVLVHAELATHGVEVLAGTTVQAITRAAAGQAGRLEVAAAAVDGTAVTRRADLVLVVVGVRPDTALAAEAGARLGVRGAIEVDPGMRTGLPDVFAAGDCVVTHHRLLGVTWLPLGTTAHKQGRVAGENAAGGNRAFAGSLGTQVVKIFDQAAARTGLRDHEARAARFDPVTIGSQADDHKAYYPGSHRITMRVTGDRATGRLLGMQLFGHKHAEIAKRIDIAAAAIYAGLAVDAISDLDLSYTPPLGSPWERRPGRHPGLDPPDPALVTPALPRRGRRECLTDPTAPPCSAPPSACWPGWPLR